MGQSCTHIVYKNGLQSTINKYNLLRDPKPLVVGIAWVVDCVEQRRKVEEAEYLIDLDEVSLLTNPHKVRLVLFPLRTLSLIHTPYSDDAPCYPNPSRDSILLMFRCLQSLVRGMSRTMVMCQWSLRPVSTPLSIIPGDDLLTRCPIAVGLDDLTPLERARRRKSILSSN